MSASVLTAASRRLTRYKSRSAITQFRRYTNVHPAAHTPHTDHFGTEAMVHIREDGMISVRNVTISSQHLREYLTTTCASPLDYPKALERSAEIGSFCLLKTTAAATADMLSHSMKERLENELAGGVQKLIENATSTNEKLGYELTGDVQKLLSEAAQTNGKLVNDARVVTDYNLGELKKLMTSEVRTMLTDVDKQTKVSLNEADSRMKGGLEDIQKLLDKNRTDSIPHMFQETLVKVTEEHGDIAKSLRRTVDDALKPLRDEIHRMSKTVHAESSKQEMLNKTPKKGYKFENEIIESLQSFKQHTKSTVTHCGEDNSQGDVMVEMDASNGISEDAPKFRIIIEAKSLGIRMGRQRIADIMKNAIEAREASCGIIVVPDDSRFSVEIGEWDEGFVEGKHWIATTLQHLVTSMRYAFTMEKIRLEREKEQGETTDKADLKHKLTEMRTTLKKTAQVKRRVTQINKSAEELRELVADMERSLKRSMDDLERELSV